MRTGKTSAVIDALNALNAWPALIIGPFQVIPGWQSEFRELGYRPEDIRVVRPGPGRRIVSTRELFLSSSHLAYITNFESVIKTDALNIRSNWQDPGEKSTGIKALRCPPCYSLPDWRAIVVDESYQIAEPSNNITTYLLKRPKVPGQYRFCLSGTPGPEHPSNFCTQYLFMDGVYFGCTSHDEYMHKYWEYNPHTYTWRVKDPQHIMDVRKYVQDRGYCVTMAELGLGCIKLRTSREVPLNKAQVELLRWLSIATHYRHPVQDTIMEMEPPVRVTFEKKVAAGVHPLTSEMISDNKILDALDYYFFKQEPFLIISRFKPPIHRAVELFKAKGVRVAAVTGDNPKEREIIRKAFQDGYLEGVIAQEKTVARGMDFSRLKWILYMSNSGSFETRDQSEDRGQHTLREDPYLVIDQHSENTNDSVLTNVLTIKRKNASFYLRQFNRAILERTL